MYIILERVTCSTLLKKYVHYLETINNVECKPSLALSFEDTYECKKDLKGPDNVGILMAT